MLKWRWNPQFQWNEGEARRQLYANDFHGKLLQAPKMVLFKVWQGVQFVS